MPEVQYLSVDSDLLSSNPWNSNSVAPENESKIRESIKRNGLFKPIIVRELESGEGYEIIGGQHRYEQAVALGYNTIPIANLGIIDERQAKEIGVIDNARYGVDDALSLGDILGDIGSVEDIQDFLPYGQSELSALISSVDIALDDLEIEENFELDEKPEAPVEPERIEKTHVIMRFKVSIADAEKITRLISTTRKQQGFKDEDELTNSGDALVHCLSDKV